MSFNRPTWYEIPITGSTLNIEKVKFNGDVDKAIDFIKTFCKNNIVEYKSWGHGWGQLTINDERPIEINPYGIDIEMMIGFCKGNLNDFQAATARENTNEPIRFGR